MVESWEEKKRRGMVTALLTGGLKKTAVDSRLKKQRWKHGATTRHWPYYHQRNHDDMKVKDL